MLESGIFRFLLKGVSNHGDFRDGKVPNLTVPTRHKVVYRAIQRL